MARLIDADALLKTGSGIKIGIPNHCHPYEAIRIQGNAFRKAVEEAPTVDAVPVKQSYWEEYETSSFRGYDKNGEDEWVKRKFYRCDRCRRGTAVKSNFCPNCGAKMDGGAENG